MYSFLVPHLIKFYKTFIVNSEGKTKTKKQKLIKFFQLQLQLK